MWQPFEAMKYLPIGFIQIANLFHTWEAVLASLAVFIGHFYDEHFDKFLNMSWLTGDISEEEMKHEHPAEYEIVMNENRTNKTEYAKSILTPLSNINNDNISNIKKVTKIFSKFIFTIIFLIISIWMLYISYKVLMEAVNTYIL
jgi:hypothetical protein